MYHLTWFKASSTRSVGCASTLYSPHHGFSSFSGLKRLILRLTFMYGLPPAGCVCSPLSVVSCPLSFAMDQGTRTTDMASILAFLRLELGNRHRLVSELDPARRLIRQGVFQPAGIVALWKIFARVRPAAFLARQRAFDQRLSQVGHAAQLDHLHQLRIVLSAAVLDFDALVSVANLLELFPHLGEPLGVAEDAGLIHHSVLQGVADVGRALFAARVHHLGQQDFGDRKSTRLNSSHGYISYAVFCLKKKRPSQHKSPRTHTPYG